MRLFQTIAQIIIATSVVNCVPVPTLVSGPSDAGRRNSRALPDPDPNVVIPVVNAKPKLRIEIPQGPKPPTPTYYPFIGFAPQRIGPGPGLVLKPLALGNKDPGKLMDSLQFPLPPPEKRPIPEWLAKNSNKRKRPGESPESGSSAVGTTQQRPAPGIPRPKRPKPNPDPDTPSSSPPKDQNPPPPALKSTDL